MKHRVSRRKRKERKVPMPPTLRYRSNSNSSRSSARPTCRMRLRPWLENLLDTGSCKGLEWLDRFDKKFVVSWRHASSHGFDQRKHGDVFSRWAQHTGKPYKDHTVNKSTFRCALSSLKDCIELTEKSVDLKGEKAKRTYQFVDQSHPQYDKKRKTKSKRKILSTKKANYVSAASTPEAKALFSGAPLQFNGGSLSQPTSWTVSKDSTGISTFVTTTTSESYSHYSQSIPHSVCTLLTESPPPATSTYCSAPYTSASFLPTTSTTTAALTHVPNLKELLSTETDHGCSAIKQSRELPQYTLKSETSPDGITSLILLEKKSDQNPETGQTGQDIQESEKREIKDVKGHVRLENSLPDFSALGYNEAYKPLNSFSNTKLNCGGMVKISTPKFQGLPVPVVEIPTAITDRLHTVQQQDLDLEQTYEDLELGGNMDIMDDTAVSGVDQDVFVNCCSASSDLQDDEDNFLGSSTCVSTAIATAQTTLNGLSSESNSAVVELLGAEFNLNELTTFNDDIFSVGVC